MHTRLRLFILPFALSMTGCQTKMKVTLMNKTKEEVWFSSSCTEETKLVQPLGSATLAHNSGQLLIQTMSNEVYVFDDVQLQKIDRRFKTVHVNHCLPSSIILTVALHSNMQIYVVPPGSGVLLQNIEQPVGYPIKGVTH